MGNHEIMDNYLYTVDYSGRVWYMDLSSGTTGGTGQKSSGVSDTGTSSGNSSSVSMNSIPGQSGSGFGSRNQFQWTLLPNPTKIDIKRVSSRNGMIWGISSDHQMHLYVHKQDIPIRVREEVYENQRWNPITNWGWQLLPTDRPNFSSEDGLHARPKNSIRCPPEWTWESDDWQIETVFNTTLLDPEGWTYAVDFPATYHAEKSWSSCVRRRKWFRIRKFNGYNRWITIPPIHHDHTTEPFTDISISSFGHEQGVLCVWALTVLGQCYFRTGVSSKNPEGKSWQLISVPKGLEACQLTVSSTGTPFVVTWTGSCLFRAGLTPRSLEGTKWIERNGPAGGLMHLSAGLDTLWAVSRDRNCWTLKNDLTEATMSDVSLRSPFDWKIIPGKIKSISVSKNDMVVLAISDDTNELVTRIGITPEQRHGTGWKEVFCNADWDAISNCSSTDTPDSGTGYEDSLSLKSIRPDYPEALRPDLDNSTSGTTGPSHTGFCWVDGGCLSALKSGIDNDIEIGPWRNEILAGIQKVKIQQTNRFQAYPNAIDESESSWKTKTCSTVRMLQNGHESSWSRGSLEILNNDTIVFHKNLNHTWMTSLNDVVSIFKVREISVSFTLRIRNPIDVGQADFVSLKFDNENEMTEWYDLILELSICAKSEEEFTIGNIWLTTTNGEVHNCGMLKILDTPVGADVTTNTSENEHPLIKGFLPGTTLTVDISIPPTPESFRFNLTGRGGLVAFHFNPRFGSTNQVVRNSLINEVWGPEERDGVFPFRPGKKYTVTLECTESHILAHVYIHEFKQKKHFTISYQHRVQPKFITNFTGIGDVHILGIRYDPKSSEEFLQPEFVTRPVPGHLWKIESTANGFTWAIGFDGNVWNSTIPIGSKKYEGFGELTTGSNIFTDSQTVYIYENERWNPVGGWCTQLLPTDRSNWSDETGRIPLDKDTIKLLSAQWNWDTDWEIDYKAPGGVDKSGWQYAIDFPASYHHSKRINDFVRRRRWKRICIYRVKGPWTHVPGVTLLDLSIQVNEDCDWEVLGVRMENGESVLRLGITPDCAAGSSWNSIAEDLSMISISGHFGQKVWAIGKNGFAYIRYSKWQMLDRPKETPLKSICVGPSGVWAVGLNHTLYRRSDILPILPEGKDWIKVCDGVSQVSLGLGEEVWALLKKGSVFTSTLAKRDGISVNNPSGIGWTHIAEGPWHYLSIAGAYKRNR